MNRRFTSLLALLLAASCPSLAIAAGAEVKSGASVVATKTLVIVGEGKNAGGVVETARKVVPEGWDARPASALKIDGSMPALWKALEAPKQRPQALRKVRDALARADLDAVVLVRVVTTKKARAVHVVLVTRDEDEAVVDQTLAWPAVATKADEPAMRAILAAPLEQRAPRAAAVTVANDAETSPASDAPTTKTDLTKDVASGGASDGAVTPREPMLVVGAMGELATRRFTYDGATLGGLRPYNLPNVAAIGARLELYPLRDSASIVSGLGIVGDFHSSIGLRSTSAGTNEQSTGSWTRFDGMLAWWVPLVASHATALAFSAGYGQERFAFSPSTPDLPSVTYRYARGGVEFRARLGKGLTSRGAAVFLGSSYLLVLSGGELSEHFRRVTMWGLEVTGGLAVYLAPAIELRLAIDYRRFSARFGGAKAGDPYVAAGALDEMARTLLELRVRY